MVGKRSALLFLAVFVLSVACSDTPRTLGSGDSPVSSDTDQHVFPNAIVLTFPEIDNSHLVSLRLVPESSGDGIAHVEITSPIGDFSVPSELLEPLLVADFFATISVHSNSESEICSLEFALYGTVEDSKGNAVPESTLEFIYNWNGLAQFVKVPGFDDPEVIYFQEPRYIIGCESLEESR